MNDMNRGSLRAIRVMLEKIQDILTDIYNTEIEKECGENGGAPIEVVHGDKSSTLSYIVDMVEDVCTEIDELVSKKCDWE